MKTLEQQRAIIAYACVNERDIQVENYKIAVNTFGTTILRSGLSAAMCLVERKHEQNPMYKKLLEHLAKPEFQIHALQQQNWNQQPNIIRKMELSTYMLTTRQVLRAVFWLKRAIQSLRAENK